MRLLKSKSKSWFQPCHNALPPSLKPTEDIPNSDFSFPIIITFCTILSSLFCVSCLLCFFLYRVYLGLISVGLFVTPSI